MQKNRIITIVLLLALLLTAALTHAQDDSDYTLDALPADTTLEAAFEDDVTTHLYGFEASAGDVIAIAMTQRSSDLDPMLVVFDSDGAVLAVDDDSGNTNLAAAISDLEIEADGVYFVLATSIDFIESAHPSDDALDYNLTLLGNTPFSDGGDSIALSAPLLENGQVISGAISEDAPLGLFAIEADAGTTLEAQLAGDFFTMLYLFDPDGQRIAVDASALALDVESDGVYLLLATDVFFFDALQGDDGFFTGGDYALRYDN